MKNKKIDLFKQAESIEGTELNNFVGGRQEFSRTEDNGSSFHHDNGTSTHHDNGSSYYSDNGNSLSSDNGDSISSDNN